ncbi:MAG: NusA-like transcription termination signal-binding factor [Nanoarchaeota archaeon]
MNRIKYDLNLMKFISLFESLTNAKVKDCIDSEQLIFVVEENEIGKAIGKHGVNVKKMIGILKRPIKIVEFSSDLLQFIKNFIYPLQLKNIGDEAGLVTISGVDTKTNGLLIGRDRKNLEILKSIVKRYFPIEDIKVV